MKMDKIKNDNFDFHLAITMQKILNEYGISKKNPK